ncbi:prepilin peptidase [Desulfotomaculum copahuensis]|uniref:prepilin peptidase n=1 Tax=Desulfotomaculum copahuensis TaxID=1838280 RepID=UPI001FA7F4B3|nr:A24 family peptidase [Desulfotomaculum copahuensis]
MVGLAAGSFLNVCIHRLPRGESVVFPPSRCPHCGQRLAARDLVPLFSYLWLKGRCRYCGSGISPRYPLVEALTGVLFAVLYMRFGLNLLLFKYLFLTSVLIVLSFIDLEHYLIPDRIIIFALAGGVIINLFTRDLTFLSVLLGLAAPAAFLLLLAVASRGGMGGGDIKLAAVTGLFLGWPLGLLAVFLGCLLGGLVGAVLLLSRIKGRKDAIPFGPFLACGAITTILGGQQILNWYLGNFRI